MTMMNDDFLDDVTPLGIQINREAVSDMWMGKRIAEVHKYDLGNRHEILNWLESVTDLHDKFITYKGVYVVDWESLKPIQHPKNNLQRWQSIRQQVTKAVLQFPVESVMDVLVKIEIPLHEFLSAMTTNKISKQLTEGEFRAFENDFLVKKPVLSDIVRKHGIGRNTVIAFRDFYKPMHQRRHGQMEGLVRVNDEQ
jgi:hypothetical protein